MQSAMHGPGTLAHPVVCLGHVAVVLLGVVQVVGGLVNGDLGLGKVALVGGTVAGTGFVEIFCYGGLVGFLAFHDRFRRQ